MPDYDCPVIKSGDDEKPRLSATWSIPSTLQPVRTLVVLRGSLKFKYAASVKTVTIGDLANWLEKRIDIPELAGLDITVDQVDEHFVVLSFPQTTGCVIKSAQFRNAHGVELQVEKVYESREGCAYKVNFAKGTMVVFQIGQDVKNVLIPFEQKNISLEMGPEKLPF
jgi:hypothetical protein